MGAKEFYDARKTKKDRIVSLLSEPISIAEEISNEYEALILQAEAMGPTDKTVVLDIDETLVHTSDDETAIYTMGILSNPVHLDIRQRLYRFTLNNNNAKRGSGAVYNMWGVVRPHFEEFKRFCFAYFKNVTVWSAGQYHYVHAMVNILFRDRLPAMVHTANDCAKREQLLTKPLSSMYRSPSAPQGMEESKTLIFDDRETVYSYDNPDNGILFPPYAPTTIENMKLDDYAYLVIMRWLMRPEVRGASDVRSLDKTTIF